MSNIKLLDIFIPAYLECALWSSTNEDGEPLDSLYDFHTDVSSEGVLRVIEDCCGFLMLAKPYLRKRWKIGDIAHDFWLTRNGGVGFSKHGVENAQKLTEIAKSFGECSVYVGDDEKLYLN